MEVQKQSPETDRGPEIDRRETDRAAEIDRGPEMIEVQK